MIVGGYVLDLYCDKREKHDVFDNNTYYLKQPNYNWIEIKHEFVGETYGECVKEARRCGWLVNRKKDKCLCKYCKNEQKEFSK